MNRSRWIWTSLWLWMVAIGTGSTAEGWQELPPPSPRLTLLEQVRDSAEVWILVGSLDEVAVDLKSLAIDLGVENYAELATQMLLPGEIAGIDRSCGMAFTDGWPINQLQLRVLDRQRLDEQLERAVGKPADSPVLQFERPEQLKLPTLASSIRRGFLADGNLVLLGDQISAEEANVLQAEWPTDAQGRLWNQLDSRTRELVLASGISAVLKTEQEATADWPFLDESKEGFLSQRTPAEREWMQQLTGILRSSRRQLLGLKYREQVLEIRARAQVGEGTSLAPLLRDDPNRADWRPGLGLERERLIAAAAIRLAGLSSSAGARVLPQWLLQLGSEQQDLSWLNGNMMRILIELMGDSWSDLNTARLAIYEAATPEDPTEWNPGAYAILGVVEARDPAIVLRELGRISRLTSPEAAAARGFERDEEIRRLIEELGNPDPDLANRAETRLVLAGSSARKELELAVQQGNPLQQDAAQRILVRIGEPDGEQQTRKAVVDPGFWTTLNPGLRLETETGQTGGFVTHTIHITPDPSKTPEEVAEAIELMQKLFGEDWNRIEVVQVREHFLFLVGTDRARLETAVARVDAGQQLAMPDGQLIPASNPDGQIQAWADGLRIRDLFAPVVQQDRDSPAPDSLPPVWLELSLQDEGVESQFRLPIQVLRQMLGNVP